MIFTELFVPRGMFSAEELHQLAGRLTLKELLAQADALPGVPDSEAASTVDPGVLGYVDSISHVVVHETAAWLAGGRLLDPAGPLRFVARVYVPGPWRKAMSPYLIASINHVLAQTGTGTGAGEGREPQTEVHVLGIPEGGYGLSGRVTGEPELMEMISQAKTGIATAGDPGVRVDPVCGMAASEMLATLEHEGTTYGFCSEGCRRHFARKLAGAASQAPGH